MGTLGPLEAEEVRCGVGTIQGSNLCRLSLGGGRVGLGAECLETLFKAAYAVSAEPQAEALSQDWAPRETLGPTSAAATK